MLGHRLSSFTPTLIGYLSSDKARISNMESRRIHQERYDLQFGSSLIYIEPMQGVLKQVIDLTEKAKFESRKGCLEDPGFWNEKNVG